jgi:hypothetical protein
MNILKWARHQWDRVSAVLLFVAGGTALWLGYQGMSTSVFPAQQLPFLLSGGLVGLFLLGLGATAWISADLRDDWRKLDRLESLLTPAPEAEVTALDTSREDSSQLLRSVAKS